MPVAKKTKKKALKKVPAAKSRNKMAALVKRMKEKNGSMDTATGAAAAWRYIDFIDPKTQMPCITQEYLFGARGLLAGRILQARARFSQGKSSWMYLQYAAAQLMDAAFCLHMETEGAAPPPDYVASIGVNPDELLMAEVQSLSQCLATVDEMICEIRGGFGGTISQAGNVLKTKYTDPFDPDMKSPILVGIDAISSLGGSKAGDADVVDLEKTAQIAYHTKKLREYFRDRVQRFRATQTLLMLASHETANINTGPARFGGGGSGDKSSLAQEAIGIQASFAMDFNLSKWWDPSRGVQLGSKIQLHTFKNKISPRYRKVDLFLTEKTGFDLVKTDVEFLLSHPASPFAGMEDAGGKQLLYRHAHGITCRPLRDKSFKDEEEFLRALNDNEDLLMSLKENMRIRGHGFDFETNLAPEAPDDPLEAEKLDEKIEKAIETGEIEETPEEVTND